MESPKRVARKATTSTPLRLGARAGYAANGFVHALIGIIILVIVFGGHGDGDQSGAFRAIAQAPLGFIALWLLAAGLWALGVWSALAGLLARDPQGQGSALRKWGRRISLWGQAVVFIALGTIAATVALGARPDADKTAEDASRSVLSVPGGPLVLAAVGVGIGIGGVVFVVMGLRRSFRERVTIPDGPLGAVVVTVGVVGFIAKGVALCAVAVLLLVAAVRVDADAAGGLDGAIRALVELPYGPAIGVVIGAGFIAYGIFCVFRARYAKLD